MNTCHDCIHEKVCVIRGFPSAFENTQWEKKPCDHFKPKTEWISVEERLPEQYGPFLIANDKGNMEVATWTKQFGWFSGGIRVKRVTHWMPLPEPPQMKGGAE